MKRAIFPVAFQTRHPPPSQAPTPSAAASIDTVRVVGAVHIAVEQSTPGPHTQNSQKTHPPHSVKPIRSYRASLSATVSVLWVPSFSSIYNCTQTVSIFSSSSLFSLNDALDTCLPPPWLSLPLFRPTRLVLVCPWTACACGGTSEGSTFYLILGREHGGVRGCLPEDCRCEFAAPPSHRRRQRTVDGSTTRFKFLLLPFLSKRGRARWRARAMLIGVEVSKTSSSPQLSEYRHNTLIPALSRCPRCKDSLAGYSPSKFSPPSCTWPIGLASHLRLPPHIVPSQPFGPRLRAANHRHEREANPGSSRRADTSYPDSQDPDSRVLRATPSRRWLNRA